MNIPSSTYRIQLNKTFTVKDLEGIADYLRQLGVSTIYAAPILQSKPGSMHGYDVIDPLQLDPEIGSLEEFKSLSKRIQENAMSWLQDIVPNHMAFDTGNLRLMDVLERGPQSRYYNFFDINWNHHTEKLRGKIGVPFLGSELSECIERGELRLSFSEAGFTVDYFDTQYPASVQALGYLEVSPEIKKHIDAYSQAAANINALDEWQDFKAKWIQGIVASASLKKELKVACAAISASSEQLISFLSRQFYLLQHWKTSEKEINYRRFFTVNELICLNMQHPAVFDEYHQLIKKLYDEKLINGVRIDHIDGLYDPSGYVKKLRTLMGRDCFIVAEKILEAKENLPQHWPIEGTSGYEFLSYVSQLVTDRNGSKKLLNFYKEVVPDIIPYPKLVLENKRLILENYMAGEWENLVAYLFELNLQGEFERERLKQALGHFMLALPVYRIYPDKWPLTENDRQVLEEAFQKAQSNGSEFSKEIGYLAELILSDTYANRRNDVLSFLKRVMQFTGPLTAKGVEDTTFYVYNPLISHDEVGDAPGTLGISVDAFHSRMAQRQKLTPLSLNATATHDTKRGEDSRLRLNILSEMPEVWKEHVGTWRAINNLLKKETHGKVSPTPNDEYFIYQSLVGGYSSDQDEKEFVKRFEEFLVKALREAKVNTNWSEPDEAYENACKKFVGNILKPEHSFRDSFIPFVDIVTRYANVYSLVQVLIKATCPGIPDIYQGCELWDLSFVDPDNRRPVDFSLRNEMLREIMEKEKEGPLAFFQFLRVRRAKGYEKMFATWKILNFRKNNPQLFNEGEYVPLKVEGKQTVLMAYARCLKSDWILVVVPLALAANQQLDQPYAETPDDKKSIVLPESAPGKWRNVFTGEEIATSGRLPVFEALKDFPVAFFQSI